MLGTPDVTDDEKHYILDSQRLLNNDPYISIRHHTFRHPEPSIGHPFLYQIEQVAIFKILGLSVYTARLPNALSGIATVLVLFFFTKQLGGKVAALAAFLVAILPMAVRYSKNAQLDTVFGLWITIIALSIWKYLENKNRFWLLMAGVATAFSISTKLNGIYTAPMVLLLLFFAKEEKFGFKLIKAKVVDSIWIFLPAATIALLLNNPYSYIDGIIHPSFQAYSFFSKTFYTQTVPILFSPTEFLYFFKTNLLLLSPGLLFTLLVSWFFLIFKIRGYVVRFLVLWIVPLFNIFIIHGLDLFGAYGWVPLIPPTALGIAYWLNTLSKQMRNILVLLITVNILPFLFLYGLLFAVFPQKNYPLNHNKTISDHFYQDIIKEVNEITPKNGRVLFLPQSYYPLFALRTDISWSYEAGGLGYNTYVVDNLSLVNKLDDVKLVDVKQGQQDGDYLLRYIFLSLN